jgi:putative transposase
MPKKRFTDEQIAFALRQAEAATDRRRDLRKIGAAEATFYRLKKVYAGMSVYEIRRLKPLGDLEATWPRRHRHSRSMSGRDLLPDEGNLARGLSCSSATQR